ncbi:MAG: HEAT repeat domain-containing protein [Pirellulales bacterium]|nr:HEAT repeat domain-containing protein [Pirellulales bacterium]
MTRLALRLAIVLLVLVHAVAGARAQQAAEAELQSLKIDPALDVDLFAAEPLVVNPAAIDVDTQGRVWVAEIKYYRRFADRPPADTIKVLEDTDGDGRADRSTVFAEGVYCPMSICVAWPKVYVATSPDLWVYEDRNNDLKADGPPQKLLTGFGGYNHDHGAHSLVLGPDHKWWMSHGDGGFNVQGTDGTRVRYRWGAVLRGELDGRQLELVAVNFRNPYEVCVSSFGEAYLSDNDNDGNFSTRICWILDRGDYGWFGAPPAKVDPSIPFAEGWHFRAHMPGYVPATLVTGFGSPCGICYYEGDALGPDYRDAPLHADAGPREVRVYRHTPAGFGQRAASRTFLTSEGDDYFRPDDVCTAPDGSVYVSDWYDGGVGGHAYNNPDQGRIFVVRPRGKSLARREQPGPYASVADAVVALASPNLATQFLARERLLAEPQTSVPALLELIANQRESRPDVAARALWVLDRIGGEARSAVTAELHHDDARYRALAVRILRRHGSAAAAEILALADDPDPAVRREVLLALPGIPEPRAFEVLVRRAQAYSGNDRYELETLNIAAGERKTDLFNVLARHAPRTAGTIQLLQVLDPQQAASLLAAGLADESTSLESRREMVHALCLCSSLEAGKTLLSFVANKAADATLRNEALERLTANLQASWRELTADDSLAQSLAVAIQHPETRLAALQLIAQYGIQGLSDPVVALATDATLPPGTRVAAIAALAALRSPEAEKVLAPLLNDSVPDVQQAALAALVQLQSWATIRQVLTAPETGELARQAVTMAMQNSPGALVLLRLIDEQKLADPLRDLAVSAARQHADTNVRVLFERFLPPGERPQRLGSAIRPAEILDLDGDAARGQQIFASETAQCRRCHVVGGLGGDLGPDLSQIGRKYERAALLETILDPSKAIAPEYVPYLVETDSGQVYVGFVVERTDERLVLKDAEGKLLHLPTAEVTAIEPQPKSLMPELVLRDITAQDAADLLAYLVSLRNGLAQVARFRYAGPFEGREADALDRPQAPEEHPETLDSAATFAGLKKTPVRWETIAAGLVTTGQATFPVVDLAARMKDRGQRQAGTVHYLAVYLDSASDQDATLLLGTDDGCKAWLNGREIHRVAAHRAVVYGQDRVAVRLQSGRNLLLIKVVNVDGPCGATAAIESPGLVQVRAD